MCSQLAALDCCPSRDAEANDLTSFGDHMANTPVPNSVIIDATASDWPAQKYLEWMKKGIHVITPNKKLNSGSLDQYRKLKQFQRDAYIHFMYEVSFTELHLLGKNWSDSQTSHLSIHSLCLPLIASAAPLYRSPCHRE